MYMYLYVAIWGVMICDMKSFVLHITNIYNIFIISMYVYYISRVTLCGKIKLACFDKVQYTCLSCLYFVAVYVFNLIPVHLLCYWW